MINYPCFSCGAQASPGHIIALDSYDARSHEELYSGDARVECQICWQERDPPSRAETELDVLRDIRDLLGELLRSRGAGR